MNKIFNFIINKSVYFNIIFILLIIGSILLIPKVKTNFDLTKYLDKNSDTRKSLDMMNNEFSSNGSFQIMINNISSVEADKIKLSLSIIDGVSTVIFDSTNKETYKDNTGLFKVFLSISNFDKSVKKTVLEIETLLNDYDYYLSGGAIDSLYLSEAIEKDMTKILILACLIILLVLCLNSTSWIEPLIFLIVIGGAVLINLGTNALLPNISFITKSICIVMQLALAMDYSIILIHKYTQEIEIQKSENLNIKKAILTSLEKSFIPILSSSLTTIVGLLSLIFMHFKIGFDIGIVLAKGILISMIIVFVFMPGIIKVFSKIIYKTRHTSLYQLFKNKYGSFYQKIAKYQYKTRYIFSIILLCLIILGAVTSNKVKYSISLKSSNDPNSKINISEKQIENEFGKQNPLVIIIPKGDIEKEEELINYVDNISINGKKYIDSCQGLLTLGLYDEYSASDIANKYSLNIEMIEDIFKELECEKIKLINLINYILENDYINKTSENKKDEYNKLYSEMLLLDFYASANYVAEMTNIDIDTINNLYVAMQKEGKSVKVKDILKFISLNKYISNYGNETNIELTNLFNKYSYIYEIMNVEYIESLGINNEESVKIFQKLQNEDKKYKYNVIIEIVNNGALYSIDDDVKNKCINEIKYINELITEYSFFEVKEKYFYLNDEIIFSMYDSNNMDYNNLISNYLVIKYLLENNYIVSIINNYQNEIDQLYEKSLLVVKEYTKEEVNKEFGLPDDIILIIFGEKERLTGKELIEYIVKNKTIDDVAVRLNEKINDAKELIDFVISMYESDLYTRYVFNISNEKDESDSLELVRELRKGIKDYYNEAYIVSESASLVDINDTFTTDSMIINLISFILIFIVIMISFKSITIPFILTFTIQGAIWLTMSSSLLTNKPIYFICYLMVMCIQMGATIDYGILYTSKYLHSRKESNVIDSVIEAADSSITTILTSGTILIIAAYIVGIVSEVSIISNLGYLLSLGSLISVIFILFFYPQVLLVLDKRIVKK